MEKSSRECALKTSPRPYLYFGKQPKRDIAFKKAFLKIRYFKRELSKTF